MTAFSIAVASESVLVSEESEEAIAPLAELNTSERVMLDGQPNLTYDMKYVHSDDCLGEDSRRLSFVLEHVAHRILLDASMRLSTNYNGFNCKRDNLP